MDRHQERWLIIEPTFSGHHFTYLFEICRGAVARGIRIVVAVGMDTQGEEIVARLKSELATESLSIVRLATPADSSAPTGILGLLKNALQWRTYFARSYRAALQDGPVDYVFVPYLDRGLFAISLLGSPFAGTPFGGITLRQRFHLRRMGVRVASSNDSLLRRWLFIALLRLRGLHRLHVIDDTLEEFVRQFHPEVAHKVLFIPDPSEPVERIAPTIARERLGLPGDATLVLVYGYIDSRKRVASLLQWLNEPDVSPAMQVLLAGTLGADVEALLASPTAQALHEQKRLWTMGRYIEQKDESMLFCAADFIWVVYDRVDLMSGVLVKATQFGCAVLFEDHGLIGRYAKRYGSTQSRSRQHDRLGRLPPGVEVRYFGDAVAGGQALPDHSWERACRIIFDDRPNVGGG